MKERYCGYCTKFKQDEGFRTVVHPNSNTVRSMCPTCQAIRKKPRSELAKLAQRDSIERKKR